MLSCGVLTLPTKLQQLHLITDSGYSVVQGSSSKF